MNKFIILKYILNYTFSNPNLIHCLHAAKMCNHAFKKWIPITFQVLQYHNILSTMPIRNGHRHNHQCTLDRHRAVNDFVPSFSVEQIKPSLSISCLAQISSHARFTVTIDVFCYHAQAGGPWSTNRSLSKWSPWPHNFDHSLLADHNAFPNLLVEGWSL